jgi:hypothetical protein
LSKYQLETSNIVVKPLRHHLELSLSAIATDDGLSEDLEFTSDDDSSESPVRPLAYRYITALLVWVELRLENFQQRILSR